MPEPLKNVYNLKFIKSFALICKNNIPNFDVRLFEKHVFSSNWKFLELKARIQHISNCLHKQMTDSTIENLNYIVQISEYIRNSQDKENTFEYLILPNYIEIYGLKFHEGSLKAIKKVTVLISCEFAIRPFILQNPKKTFEHLYIFSKHKHPSLRRLASEGCRPRLPWGVRLIPLQKNPSPILPILETLKDDTSLYVRRSVANNINDISKDNADLVLKLLKRWKGFSKERNWLIKHAARTLLKRGHPEALALFDYGDVKNVEIKNFNLIFQKVYIGSYLKFIFHILNKGKKTEKIRLEYFIYFLLASGKLSKKKFKISERELIPNEILQYERRHSFKTISTRKYYTGKHKVSLVINGDEKESIEFNLVS